MAASGKNVFHKCMTKRYCSDGTRKKGDTPTMASIKSVSFFDARNQAHMRHPRELFLIFTSYFYCRTMSNENRNYVIYVFIWLPTKAKKPWHSEWNERARVMFIRSCRRMTQGLCQLHSILKPHFRNGHQRVKLCQHS